MTTKIRFSELIMEMKPSKRMNLISNDTKYEIYWYMRKGFNGIIQTGENTPIKYNSMENFIKALKEMFEVQTFEAIN